jgi:hypothetical protein
MMKRKLILAAHFQSSRRLIMGTATVAEAARWPITTARCLCLASVTINYKGKLASPEITNLAQEALN